MDRFFLFAFAFLVLKNLRVPLYPSRRFAFCTRERKKIFSRDRKKEVREQKNSSENTTHKKKLLRIYHNIIMYDTEENLNKKMMCHIKKLNGYDCVVSCMLAYYFVTNSSPLLFCQDHIGMCQNRLALALLSVVT